MNRVCRAVVPPPPLAPPLTQISVKHIIVIIQQKKEVRGFFQAPVVEGERRGEPRARAEREFGGGCSIQGGGDPHVAAKSNDVGGEERECFAGWDGVDCCESFGHVKCVVLGKLGGEGWGC